MLDTPTIMTLCDYSLWKLTAEAGESIKPVLHQLCVTFVDYILEKEFYPTMNVSCCCAHGNY
ncbi:hypothetical protein GBAR_LOCUS10587 [Geodia barretti]|uniref:Uncharacterized protein n=1 Tax=Geodia barretti TaxID=519541 RepID=A0AA35RTJ5_GEOBA|nr:hypothetical protein GBAR_LOCUS10587 [Geodia barretti]